MQTSTITNSTQTQGGTVTYATETHTVVLTFKSECTPIKNFKNLVFKVEPLKNGKKVAKMIFNKRA